MATMALDIGTTHLKAAVFGEDGSLRHSAVRDTVLAQVACGIHVDYDPERLWEIARATMSDCIECCNEPIEAIAVTGMAEAGLFLSTQTGAAVCAVMPWFDMRPVGVFKATTPTMNVDDRFVRTGLHPHHKYSMFKIIYRLEHDAVDLRGAVWLSVPDYIAFRLTGVMATDRTLAVRTWLFDMIEGDWVDQWLSQIGLNRTNMPHVVQSGHPIGTVNRAVVGCLKGKDTVTATTLVAIAGHDHVCAAAACAVDDTETAFDSMGTAETLMGSVPGVTLDHTHRDSGFLFGRQPVGERLFWLGSAAAAGASVEWVRRLVAMEDQPYAKLNDAVLALPSGPTGITFVPYLNGSNAPHFKPEATGAFFGLMIHHSRAHLIKAVFEGVAMEIEWIRAHACASMGINVKRLRCVGGGTKNSLWLQIKADVCGIPLEVPDLEEATLSGAAQVVSLGCALKERCMPEGRSRVRVYQPDEELVQRYREQYQRTFLPALQAVGLPLSVAGEIH